MFLVDKYVNEEDDNIMSPNISDIELAYRKARAIKPLRYQGTHRLSWISSNISTNNK